MSIPLALILGLVVALLTDWARGYLVRGVELGSLMALRGLIRLSDPQAAEALRSELVEAIKTANDEARQGAKDDIKRIGMAVRQPNDLLANPVYRAGLQAWVSPLVRMLGLGTAVWLVVFAAGAGWQFTEGLQYGWSAALVEIQTALMSVWFAAAALRLLALPRWSGIRRWAGSTAWVAYLGAVVALAFECPRTSAGAAAVEAAFAVVAVLGVVRVARGGDGRWIAATIPLLVIEACRVTDAYKDVSSGVPAEAVLTLVAAVVVLAFSTRHRPAARIVA